MSSPTTITRPDPTSEELLSGPTPALRQPRAFRRFLLWLFAIPVLLYLPVIPLVRTPGYMHWWPSHWGPMLDFGWNSRGQDADVILFGDSSAFLGVDPRLVNRQLGVKTLVLPNTVGSLPVMSDKPLAAYLARNRKPELIVLYFTAWDLNFGARTDTKLYEGEEILLRHGTAAEIIRFALQHPFEVPVFPLRAYSSLGSLTAKGLALGHDRQRETAAALGHTDYLEITTPMLATCTLPKQLTDATDATGVQQLAVKYRALGYRVETYLAPMPRCTNAARFSAASYPGLASVPPVPLPPASFIQDGMYAHVAPRAVPVTSQLFAEWLAKTLPLKVSRPPKEQGTPVL